MNAKTLSLPILISLVVGNMIGTGIYILPATLAKYGTISILSWGFTGLGAILLGLTFTYLNKRFPKTGGAYVYCKEAFGRLVGFITAYSYWASYWVSVAGLAVSTVGYMGFIFPALNPESGQHNHYFALTIELGFVWLFTIINILGLYLAGVFQLILTIIKIVPLFAIIIFGLAYVHLDHLYPFTMGPEGMMAISSAAGLTFWAFLGFESATVPAENTGGYRDIFKATIFGTLFTSLIYVASTVVLMGMFPISQLAHSPFPFALAGNQIFGAGSAMIIVICAVISGLGALNACVLIQGQVLYSAARDHLFPTLFAKLSDKDAPIAAQVFSSSLVSLLLVLTMTPNLLKQFDLIALLAVFLLLLVYAISALAELKFLIRDHQSFSKLLCRPAAWVVIFATAYSIWMIFGMETKILLIGSALILICVPIYLLRRLVFPTKVD